MTHPLDKQGTLQIVLERFQKQHLPRILEIKKLVDSGKKLNESEIHFLSEVIRDTQQYASFVSTHEEFKELFSHVCSLYDEIATKALNNEKT